MPIISENIPYNGAKERVSRLGLNELIEEIKAIITKFDLRVEEKKDAN